MNNNRKRLAMVTGTAFALVLSGASLVSAQTPNQGTTQQPQQVQLNGGDQLGGGTDLHGDGMGGGRGMGGDRGGFGGRGPGGMGDLGGGIVDRFENLVSQETVTLDADGNVLTSKVEHGTVSAVADGTITIDLATGDSVTIATAANTTAYGWDTTTRPVRSEIALADIAVGADVMVWSQSQDDGSFLAQRVAVLPAASTTTDSGTTPEASPDASPAAVG